MLARFTAIVAVLLCTAVLADDEFEHENRVSYDNDRPTPVRGSDFRNDDYHHRQGRFHSQGGRFHSDGRRWDRHDHNVSVGRSDAQFFVSNRDEGFGFQEYGSSYTPVNKYHYTKPAVQNRLMAENDEFDCCE